MPTVGWLLPKFQRNYLHSLKPDNIFCHRMHLANTLQVHVFAQTLRQTMLPGQHQRKLFAKLQQMTCETSNEPKELANRPDKASNGLLPKNCTPLPDSALRPLETWTTIQCRAARQLYTWNSFSQVPPMQVPVPGKSYAQPKKPRYRYWSAGLFPVHRPRRGQQPHLPQSACPMHSQARTTLRYERLLVPVHATQKCQQHRLPTNCLPCKLSSQATTSLYGRVLDSSRLMQLKDVDNRTFPKSPTL